MTQTHKQMVIARRAQRRMQNNNLLNVLAWLHGNVKTSGLTNGSCTFSRLEN